MPNNEPTVKIISPFVAVELPISELTPRERNVLAPLLGLVGAKKEAFKVLRAMKGFKKLQPKDVWNTCPKRARFATDVEVIVETKPGKILAGSRAKTEDFLKKRWEKAEVLKKKVLGLLPEARVTAGLHIIRGHCPKCNTTHSFERLSVMVSCTVAGVPFSKLYKV